MIVSAFLLAETEVVKDVMAEVELTEKQKRLVDYFIETGNQTEAAIKAGYSKKNARFIASKTLDLPYVKAFLEKRLKEIEENRIAKAKEQIGANDRIKAAVQLAKRYGLDRPEDADGEAHITFKFERGGDDGN